ncbi:hypothetical protein [Bacillus sp. BP-3]|uniref:hypothetical protein n=1 Tax=Bacillus sp. BP-3 TaxID=3022773 RepID=UPI00232F4DB8|nr:hypothetical protein [Bacillus sp. BP-3]MDC2867522.1 hypothetical protein [Bacillus sp. BP-3]
MGNIYLREVPTQKDYDTALKIGLLKSNVDFRLMNGWSLKEAITKPSIRGKNVSERKKMLLLAQKNGISESTFMQRVKKGWTPYDAATKKPGKYGDVIELRKQNGISQRTFYKRIENGMDQYTAATKPLDNRGGKTRKEN